MRNRRILVLAVLRMIKGTFCRCKPEAVENLTDEGKLRVDKRQCL
jgi:hypothetical protein